MVRFQAVKYKLSHTSYQQPHKLVRVRLHGGGEPQVGEVTRLAVVEKLNALTCNLTTPGCWGEVSLGCCCASN